MTLVFNATVIALVIYAVLLVGAAGWSIIYLRKLGS